MTNRTDFAKTPKYVLKSGKQPIHPTINFDDPESNCICVYGFSDKPIYDQFIKNSKQLLTPYPLVEGFLANQIAELDTAAEDRFSIGLVIMDAVDPNQPVVSAATMAAVLDARKAALKKVPVEFEFHFDSETGSYHNRDSKQTSLAKSVSTTQ